MTSDDEHHLLDVLLALAYEADWAQFPPSPEALAWAENLRERGITGQDAMNAVMAHKVLQARDQGTRGRHASVTD